MSRKEANKGREQCCGASGGGTGRPRSLPLPAYGLCFSTESNSTSDPKEVRASSHILSSAPSDVVRQGQLRGKCSTACQSAGPNGGHTAGLRKCQLRAPLWPGSLAEPSREKLKPEDVFVLNSVGPRHAKNISLQLRYFSPTT